MTHKFGFEVEGFLVKNNTIVVPPQHFPKDGFPGLIEIRTEGGGDLFDQFFNLYSILMKEDLKVNNHQEYTYDFTTYQHRFSASDISYMRRTSDFFKSRVDVQSLYGKEPRSKNGVTLASFQINISNQIQESYWTVSKDGKTVSKEPDKYGPVDIPKIVRALDIEFKNEIKDSGRQPGIYAIKENKRLEYRSLPNFVWEDEHLISRLAKVFKEIRII